MSPYVPPTDYSDEVSKGLVDHRFGDSGVPALSEEQVVRIKSIREHARLFARHIVSSIPPSWEQDEALKSLDNSLSWAVKAISRWE